MEKVPASSIAAIPLSDVACHIGSGVRGAWRLGLHHGLFCAVCRSALMVIQLVLGVMSLTVMVIVAVAIAIEKMAPRGEQIARWIGAASIVGGVVLLARSIFIR
jgi:predicted metal-binding membrane protein